MPLQKYMWVLLVFPWHFSSAQPKNDSVFSAATLASVRLFDAAAGHDVPIRPTTRLRLFVFLSPECPICQNYTRTLNRLNKQYTGSIEVDGIIPGKTWTATDINAFAAKYHILYPLWMDRSLSLAHYLQASATPEVILLTADNDLIYKGAIDNWFKSLGKSRSAPTQNYLQDAIDQALRHAAPAIKRTTPVGCLINDF
jgi:hypothetical protein